MHPASTVLHRAVAARFPRPPGMRSASLAQVHGQLSLHRVVPLILAVPPQGSVILLSHLWCPTTLGHGLLASNSSVPLQIEN